MTSTVRYQDAHLAPHAPASQQPRPRPPLRESPPRRAFSLPTARRPQHQNRHQQRRKHTHRRGLMSQERKRALAGGPSTPWAGQTSVISLRDEAGQAPLSAFRAPAAELAHRVRDRRAGSRARCGPDPRSLHLAYALVCTRSHSARRCERACRRRRQRDGPHDRRRRAARVFRPSRGGAGRGVIAHYWASARAPTSCAGAWAQLNLSAKPVCLERETPQRPRPSRASQVCLEKAAA